MCRSSFLLLLLVLQRSGLPCSVVHGWSLLQNQRQHPQKTFPSNRIHNKFQTHADVHSRVIFNRKISLVTLCSSQSSSSSSSTSPLVSTTKKPYQKDAEEDEEGYAVRVTYEDRSCDIIVRPYETILEAIERNGTPQLLSIPSPPSDCRRGNCMTCAAIVLQTQHQQQHDENSQQHQPALDSTSVTVEDGLAPYQSKALQSKGCILTCSSYVHGPGLSIQLNYQNDIWEEMYKTRLQDESIQSIGRQASAKVIRMAAERNIPKFKAQTEKVWEKS